jgi:hypothetical protein
MSAGNPTPLLTLVREDSLRTSELGSLRYPAGTKMIDNAYDEIRLQTPRGESAAIPTLSRQNRDVQHELIDGSLSWTKRVLASQIDLAVDYIDNATRRRLEKWMMDRARVLFTPGYGPATELYWRPRELATSPNNDLTGRWPITSSHTASSSWVWDAGNGGVMRYFGSTVAKVLKTDFGAGQVFSSERPNLFYTGSPPGSYPIGAEAYYSGWGAWGSWLADIEIDFYATGFGCTDCPGSLRAYSSVRRTGDGSNARALGRNIPSSVSGAGTLWCGVFLKGRFGSGSELQIGTNNGFFKSISLAGMDLSRWTFVHIGAYYANWPGSTGTTIQIYLTPAVGVSDDFDVQVGPSIATFSSGTAMYGDAFPQWINSTRASFDALIIPNFVMPRSGAMMFALYVPRWVSYGTNQPLWTPLISGDQPLTCYVYSRSSNYPNANIAVYYGGGANDYYGGPGSGVSSPTLPLSEWLKPGSVQTICFTWENAQSKLYANGRLLATRPGSISTSPAAATKHLYSLNIIGASPLLPLAARIENNVLSADEIADLHATYSDKASAGLIAAARGRVYQIEDIPSIPRTIDTGTNWVGNLRLRQVDYVPALSDVTTREP